MRDVERYSLRTVNKATSECWHAVLLVNPGPTSCTGWGRTLDCSHGSSAQQHRDRRNLPCCWPHCAHWGPKQRLHPAFKNKKTKGKACVSRSDPNQQIRIFVSYGSSQDLYRMTITSYRATSISRYILLVTASRHHAHPATWQDSGTRDGPRTFLACREQTKLSVVVADLWSVRWSSSQMKPLETWDNDCWSARSVLTHVIWSVWPWPCVLFLQLTVCTRYWWWRTVLARMTIWWAALLTELKKVFRETSISSLLIT